MRVAPGGLLPRNFSLAARAVDRGDVSRSDAPPAAPAPKARRQKTPPVPPRRPQLHEPELVRIRAEKAARLQELEPFNPLKPLEPLSPRLKRRWKMYVIGAVIFFPLATWLFTPAGFKSLWFQVIVSAA
jgi:hypothetical protein